jgi:transposase
MENLFWLSDRQMRLIEPYFPLSHGVGRIDDRRVISGIIHVIRNGLRWCDAPKDMARTRHSIIASSAGVGLVCSTRYSRRWHRRRESQTGL